MCTRGLEQKGRTVKISIDSNQDSVDEAVRVVGAVYGVTLTVDRGEVAVASTPTAMPKSSATRAPRKKVAASTRRRSSRGTAAAVPTSSELRAWAKREGMIVSDRGRIPRSVLDAWSNGEAKR